MTTTARRLTGGALILSTGEILGKVATLAVFSLVAHRLGAAEFGVFNVGLGVGMLLASVVSLGLDQRFVQLVGDEPESLNARLSSLLALRLALTAAVVAVSAIVLAVVEDDASRRLAILVLILAGCADVLVEGFRTAANIRGVQTIAAAVLVVQRLVAFGVIALVLYLGAGVVAVAVAYAAASIISLLLMAAISRVVAGVRPTRRLLERAHTRDFLSSVRVTGLNDLVTMTLFRLDVVLLAVIAGDLAVGQYTAAYRLLETVLFISWSICRVGQPVIADTSRPMSERSRVVTASYVMIFAVYLPYAAVLLTRGSDVVRLLFGDEFDSVGVVYVLAAAPVVFGLAQVSASTLLALRPDPAVLRASSIALALNVVLNLVFIPIYGAVAAAVVTTLTYATQSFISMSVVRRVLPFEPMARSVTTALAASGVAAAVMLVPMHVVPALLVGGAVYALAWFALTKRWDPATFRLVRHVVRPS